MKRRFSRTEADIVVDAAPADVPSISSPVRPGRSRTRPKGELDDKVKKPADTVVRKKSPPARKAPSRGRYVDEYAQPAA